MHAMPVVIPLSRTASLTSSVMSRTDNPPAVRSSVWRWKTFTARILTIRGPYVTWEPSVPGGLVRGRLAGRGHPAAVGLAPDPDCPLHALVSVAIDRAVHLEGAVLGEDHPDGQR